LIYAAAAGTVLNVKLTKSTSRGAFGGAGNTITILHPNGVVTSYGHIAVSLVNPGNPVSQGQAIALMGGKPGTAGAGLSTGCHVHFQVSGAVNPFR
jgi:murein DD-endopeptidase MepM/ murein hydrolase activator NlpD